MNDNVMRLMASVVALGLCACDVFDFGGGGGGGESDGGVSFAKGFVYVRRDDRNLFVVDDSAPDEVTKLTGTGGVATPSLSRDGKQVVYAVRDGADSSLVVLTLATGNRSTVFRGTANEKNVRTPVFSPDGASVAFAYDLGAGSAVGRVNIDATGFEKVAGDATLSAAYPSFLSADELLVARGVVGLRFTQVERVNLTTGMATSVVGSLGNEAQGVANRLVASPDGARAVFDGFLSNGGTRLFVLDLGTKQVSARLNEYMGESNANDTSPCWLGLTQVGFSSDSGGNDAVYSIAAMPGGSRTVLVPKAIEPWYGP